MKKIVLLTSHPYASVLIDYLRQQQMLLKVFVEEEASMLIGYFQQQFVSTSFEVFAPSKLRSVLNEDVTLITYGVKTVLKKDLYSKSEMALNIHFGRLPEEQGPDPLFWAMRSGNSQITITVHLLDEVVDGGDVVSSAAFPIDPKDNYGMAFSRLSSMAPQVLIPVFQGFANRTQQDTSKKNYQSRPDDSSCLIDWSKMKAQDIHNLVKACNPKYNGAITNSPTGMLRILETTLVEPSEDMQMIPGTVASASEEKGLLVCCMDKQLLRLDILNINEGYFTGSRLAAFGITKGMRLG